MAHFITSLSARSDNYIHIFSSRGCTAAVDPSSADAVLSLLATEGLTLTHILITHHHSDHIAGAAELKSKTGCSIIAPDDPRIPVIDRKLSPTEKSVDTGLSIKVLHTPGHTSTHVCFYIEDEGVVFTGDTLFQGGCGRILEGDAAQMWQSLGIIAQLPLDTRIYPGHDYAVDNLEFAHHMAPWNTAVSKRLADFKEGPLLPSSDLRTENATNVFLLCSDSFFRNTCGLPDDPIAAFAEVRARKDKW